MRRLDAHVHAWAPPSAARPHVAPMLGARGPPLPGDAAALLATLDAAGVHGALLVQPACYGSDHSYVREAAAASGGRLRVCASIDPTLAPADAAAFVAPDLAALRLNPYLPGWGAAGLASETGIAACRAAGGRGIPVGVMAFKGLAPLEPQILALAAACPDTTFLLDHCGFVAGGSVPSGADAAALLRLATALPTLAVKASALFRVAADGRPPADPASGVPSLVRWLLDTLSADRVAWGSDWPWSTEHALLSSSSSPPSSSAYADSWQLLDGLIEAGVVTAGEAEAVGGGTAARLFGF